MNEIFKLIPLLFLSILLFFGSTFFLKKDKDSKNSTAMSEFGKLMATRTKYVRIFSIILFVMMLLKIIYILFSNM